MSPLNTISGFLRHPQKLPVLSNMTNRTVINRHSVKLPSMHQPPQQDRFFLNDEKSKTTKTKFGNPSTPTNTSAKSPIAPAPEVTGWTKNGVQQQYHGRTYQWYKNFTNEDGFRLLHENGTWDALRHYEPEWKTVGEVEHDAQYGSFQWHKNTSTGKLGFNRLQDGVWSKVHPHEMSKVHPHEIENKSLYRNELANTYSLTEPQKQIAGITPEESLAHQQAIEEANKADEEAQKNNLHDLVQHPS